MKDNWISVKTGLPTEEEGKHESGILFCEEYDGEVFASHGYHNKEEGFVCYSSWCEVDGYRPSENVICWQPYPKLPEPPKE